MMPQSLARSGLLFLLLLAPRFCFAQAAESARRLELMLSELRQNNVKLADELDKRLKQSQKEVEQFKKGLVIFGRIQLEGGKDPRAVVSQMIIQEDGYFVDAIGAAGNPIGFRLHGYESVNVTPEGTGPIEDLGVIQMKPLPADRLASVTGRLRIEPKPNAPQMDQVVASWSVVADPINTPHNGTEGLSAQSGSLIKSKIAADGTFNATGMSPGKYSLHVTAPHCVQHFQTVDFTEGEARELDPIRLEMARKVNIEFAVSKEAEFSDATFEKTTLKADDRWRASKDVPAYGFDLLVAQKDGKLLFDYRYGPCHIKDLGEAQLTDELAVDVEDLERHQPQNVPIEDGHVYVIHQSSWKHWILLRATFSGTDH